MNIETLIGYFSSLHLIRIKHHDVNRVFQHTTSNFRTIARVFGDIDSTGLVFLLFPHDKPAAIGRHSGRHQFVHIMRCRAHGGFILEQRQHLFASGYRSLVIGVAIDCTLSLSGAILIRIDTDMRSERLRHHLCHFSHCLQFLIYDFNLHLTQLVWFYSEGKRRRLRRAEGIDLHRNRHIRVPAGGNTFFHIIECSSIPYRVGNYALQRESERNRVVPAIVIVIRVLR